ncbi:hypothetical protein BSZ39_04365 [Bowdeniella nasicola]|uniref:NADP-dependent oxidoreductase domain-containing protein n=1 Tax=Bowdeniella nasicola TaxID=208480 RepID=A0A1Q5Q3K5_9ACTO|nr:aldo/keto reductase [Bowdeniella nasicola]OKL54396.1 hypothetical protein BSZ39_04365 [Bowdeniella nasicola]
MGLGEDIAQAEAVIDTALRIGITLLDTADIYGGGASERVLGEVLAAHPSWRKELKVQTKFGIVLGSQTTYRQDGDYVSACVEASLNRLQVDRLDALLIHRPDPLAGGLFETDRETSDAIRAARAVVARIASEQAVAPAAVVLAWLTKHPAGIVPVVGSSNPDRIASYADLVSVSLSREQFYELYAAARGRPGFGRSRRAVRQRSRPCGGSLVCSP